MAAKLGPRRDGPAPDCVTAEPEDLSCAISIHPTTSHVRLKVSRAALARAFIQRHIRWFGWSCLAGTAGVLTYAILAPLSGKLFQISLPWTVEVPIIAGIFLLGTLLTYLSQVKKHARH